MKNTANRELQKAFNYKKIIFIKPKEICCYEQNLKLKQSKNHQN